MSEAAKKAKENTDQSWDRLHGLRRDGSWAKERIQTRFTHCKRIHLRIFYLILLILYIIYFHFIRRVAYLSYLKY